MSGRINHSKVRGGTHSFNGTPRREEASASTMSTSVFGSTSSIVEQGPFGLTSFGSARCTTRRSAAGGHGGAGRSYAVCSRAPHVRTGKPSAASSIFRSTRVARGPTISAHVHSHLEPLTFAPDTVQKIDRLVSRDRTRVDAMSGVRFAPHRRGLHDESLPQP